MEERRDQKVCCFPLGLRPYSLMRMLSHESELPCLTLPIRLVCPAGRRKSHKSKWLPLAVQNEPLQRLRTVTSDLPGAYPADASSFYHGWDEWEPLELLELLNL